MVKVPVNCSASEAVTFRHQGTERQAHRERQRDKLTERDREGQRDKLTERDRERQRDKLTDVETEKDRERKSGI